MWDNVKDKNVRQFRSLCRVFSRIEPLAEAGPSLARYVSIEGTMPSSRTTPDLRSAARTPEESRPENSDVQSGPWGTNRFMVGFRMLMLVFGFLLCCQALVLVRYWEDHRFLETLAAQITDPTAPPSEQTKQILTYFRGKPRRTNFSYFMLPVFDFLRPTARQVAEHGGDCADRSRLTLILLQMHNIQAEKWTLYTADGHARHSVVEVNTEQGKMVADPLFGLFFPRPEGGYYSVSELRSDPDLVRERVIEMESHHQEPLAAQIERYPVSVYSYRYAKTMNWDKSPATRLVYRALRKLIGGRADDLRRPVWPEEPALVIAFGLGLVQIVIIFSLLVLRRFAMRRGLALWREAQIISSGATSSIPA